MTRRDYTILVTNKRGHVRQVQRRDLRHHPIADHRIFTISSKKGHHPSHWHFTHAEANQIKAHFQRSGYRVEVARGRKYPWLILAAGGAHWPTDHHLLAGMNAAARDVGRRIKIISGKRTQQGCNEAWYRYQHGGPVAASPHGCNGHCCSNHFTGHAADSGWITSKGNYLSVGLWRTGLNALSRHNVSLAVPSEPWHLEYDPGHVKRRWRGY